MDPLDNYRPWESHLCGNDLLALEKAHARCRVAMNNPALSWLERERAREMLSAGSLVELESIKAAYAEVVAALPTK